MVVFLADREGLARAGEVKKVSAGYARNFLIPRNVAMLATPASVKNWEDRKRAEEKRVKAQQEHLRKMAEQLNGMTVSIKAKTGGKQRLYGSVTAAHIATALEGQGYKLDRKQIELSGPIRRLGNHQVLVRIAPESVSQLTVVVEAADERNQAAPT